MGRGQLYTHRPGVLCFFGEMQRSDGVGVGGGGCILRDQACCACAEKGGGGGYTNRPGVSCLLREMERCAVIWWGGWGRDTVG